MESQNPWWYDEIDKTYEEWVRKEIRWIPPIIEQFDFEPFSLNFVVGPRQVGKTTALKIWVHKRLLPKMNPKSVFYFSCEELTDFRELGEVLDDYVNFKNENGISLSFIILDEITFVEDWHRALKIRIDQGVFKKDVIVISGSASLEILKQKEYFPGRRGKGKDIVFYPMSFSQYARALRNIEVMRRSLPEVEHAMKANKVHEEILKDLFDKYLSTGGFPLSIEDIYMRGKVSFETRKVYIDWLRNDFVKLGRNESYMKEILAYVVGARLTPISWLSVSRQTSISSPHTAQAYLEDLEKLFVVKILNFLDQDSRIAYRKNKKIHVTDPFLYGTICEFTQAKINEDDMLESLVATHLARKYPVFYWRNKTEVDVVVKVDQRQIGVEIKTKFGSWTKPRHLRDVHIITKKEAPLFLASIDV
jgi:predicted AAA+ superfamily ATPase